MNLFCNLILNAVAESCLLFEVSLPTPLLVDFEQLPQKLLLANDNAQPLLFLLLITSVTLLVVVSMLYYRQLRINSQIKHVCKQLELALEHEQDRQHAILETANEGFWDWNPQSDEVYYAPRWKLMLGYQEHELPSTIDTWKQLLHNDDRDRVLQGIKACLSHNHQNFLTECRLRHKNGQWVSILTKAKLFKNDQKIGARQHLIGTTADLSELKLREAKLIEHQTKLRETMIEEVHHRIKNNIQGIIGLLRQSVQNHSQLASPLNKAISQLQTITAIHGLQSNGVSDKIGIADLTKAICDANSNLWQTPIQFTVSNDRIPWIIAESEALPIALALNELVLNAIKHSPEPHDVRVTAGNNKECGYIEISISNLGYITESFSQDFQFQVGSGLKLAQSLLPKHATKLTWQQKQQTVQTTLTLDFSILELEKQVI